MQLRGGVGRWGLGLGAREPRGVYGACSRWSFMFFFRHICDVSCLRWPVGLWSLLQHAGGGAIYVPGCTLHDLIQVEYCVFELRITKRFTPHDTSFSYLSISRKCGVYRVLIFNKARNESNKAVLNKVPTSWCPPLSGYAARRSAAPPLAAGSRLYGFTNMLENR